jgi:hypothetical protein
VKSNCQPLPCIVNKTVSDCKGLKALLMGKFLKFTTVLTSYSYLLESEKKSQATTAKKTQVKKILNFLRSTAVNFMIAIFSLFVFDELVKSKFIKKCRFV